MKTKEDIQKALIGAKSFNQVMKNLGYVPTGPTAKALKSKMLEYGLPIPVYSRTFGVAQSLESILVENSSFSNNVHLKSKLIKEGLLINRCATENCPTWNFESWCGKPLVLQLDHINGVSNDNRLENLRLLCPNCHTQTSTWGRKG